MDTVRSMNGFALWLRANNLTPAEFARQRGWQRLRVSRYASGERVPEPEAMVEIYIATGGEVTPNSFYPLPVLAADQQTIPPAQGDAGQLHGPAGASLPAGSFSAAERVMELAHG